MTLTLPAVAASTTPTVVKTFFQHYMTQLKKEKQDRKTEAKDEFMFHEAFAIVKRFISLATRDTVESLQNFTNTYVPPTPGSTNLRLLIPITSCNQAAAMLIEYFGEEDLKKVVGGSRWWQVRGLKGVQGEWIAMKEDWKRAQKVVEVEAKEGNDDTLKKKAREVRPNRRHERSKSQRGVAQKQAESGAKKSETRVEEEEETDTLDEVEEEPTESFEELDRLKRVMYYIHGGGYYFGSISTHRLMITRLARKFGGRAFAVQYRLSPQWPWPCPVQDVLAGYLYLIDPPPEAKHKPIDPAHIVIAGDSAGGGLALALLGVLRDLNKPMPAGAVLLSPWCDLTHSFPSILQNTETDIIPRYSFIHKPSTLWPVPGVKPEDKQTTATKESGTSMEKNNDAADPPKTKRASGLFHKHEKEPGMAVLHGVEKEAYAGNERSKGFDSDQDHLAVRREETKPDIPAAPHEATEKVQDLKENGSTEQVIPKPFDHLYSDALNIPMKEADGKEVNIELRQQIQLYATNAQLYHPLCSPILQGSLGGLPPLYILAGDAEVLRDEIIYLAHRAARPDQYPLKKELMDANERCRQDAERFNSQPTKVHLQVYDGQPHVLTLFSFTTSARYAYRAIASFVKHVTGAPTNVINPFPHLENTSSLGRPVSEAPSNPQTHKTMVSNEEKENGDGHPTLPPIDTDNVGTHVDTPEMMSAQTKDDSSSNLPASSISSPVDAPVKGESLRQKRRRDVTLGIENRYDGQVPLRRPTYIQEMIRERVDIRGQLRPLEDEHLLQALQVPNEEIGKIKSGPVSRYLTGQEMWDKKFKRTAKKVDKQRSKNEAKAQQMLEQAAREGLLGRLQAKEGSNKDEKKEETSAGDSWYDDGWADLASFGPLDLLGEVPPPSAVAGRRDTPDALELIRQSLHMRAYRLRGGEELTEVGSKISFGSHKAGKRTRTRVKIREAVGGGGRQSAAERQVNASRGSYGLRAWGDVMNYFTGKSQEKTRKSQEKTRKSQEKTKKQMKKYNQKTMGVDDPNGASNAEWVDSSSADNLHA